MALGQLQKLIDLRLLGHTPRNDLTLVFEPPKPTTITTEEATDIFCAVLLPHAANKFTSVRIIGPFNERQQHFWLD